MALLVIATGLNVQENRQVQLTEDGASSKDSKNEASVQLRQSSGSAGLDTLLQVESAEPNSIILQAFCTEKSGEYYNVLIVAGVEEDDLMGSTYKFFCPSLFPPNLQDEYEENRDPLTYSCKNDKKLTTDPFTTATFRVCKRGVSLINKAKIAPPDEDVVEGEYSNLGEAVTIMPSTSKDERDKFKEVSANPNLREKVDEEIHLYAKKPNLKMTSSWKEKNLIFSAACTKHYRGGKSPNLWVKVSEKSSAMYESHILYCKKLEEERKRGDVTVYTCSRKPIREKLAHSAHELHFFGCGIARILAKPD